MHTTISNIEEFCSYFRIVAPHPLVTVAKLSDADASLFEPTDFDMYCVVLLESNFGELVKSDQAIRYQPNSLFTLRPGQVVAMNLNEHTKPQGWILAFRKELLMKTGLGRDFYMFDFFNHDVEEALELTKSENKTILNCYANLAAELQTPPDYLSGHMIRLAIGQLLSYCKRYFERQYAERLNDNNIFRMKLETMIDNYLSSGSPAQHGQPTVAWCASQFGLTANYFGSLVKKELHVTAQDYIQSKIVETAKYLLDTSMMSVNEIAEELGFAYPNHFNRMFKQRVGITPLQYRRKE